jgi:hypothetical protein
MALDIWFVNMAIAPIYICVQNWIGNQKKWDKKF